MHIVANSNSIDDQIVKLNVSKKVNNYINLLFQNKKNYNKDEAKEIIEENIYNILDIANSEIELSNENYLAHANIGKISYDEKHSDMINMDKGTYDSLQIILGEGKGENFWSLIFPYSYNQELTGYINEENSENILENENIEIKSGIIENLQKALSNLHLFTSN